MKAIIKFLGEGNVRQDLKEKLRFKFNFSVKKKGLSKTTPFLLLNLENVI
jgi:hypothetical protein